MKWEILDGTKVNSIEVLQKVIFKNRGLKSENEVKDFLEPKNPKDINLIDLGVPKASINRVLQRLKLAKEKKEKIVIFGDYDADGVCSTAILWEALYKLGFDALPYIPDRFEEGYGIKSQTFKNSKFKALNPALIVTVDNGIVAHSAIKTAKNKKIDVIVVDHHQKTKKKLDTEYIIHSTEVCGSALSWFLAKELKVFDNLELVAIGTVADQMPLLGINRSLVKYGLEELNKHSLASSAGKTKKLGLKELIKSAGISKVGVYEIGFIIAPRINAMGRLLNATDSLRLLCTRDKKKSLILSKLLNDTNLKRQQIVEDVLIRTLKEVDQELNVIVIEGDYHEGVIGLASGRVTEKLYKPSIIFSKGEKISKASARSISGFNIIEAIKETGLIIEGGGHPMAAGFSIETKKISLFKERINEISKKYLNKEMLLRKLKIDAVIDFSIINQDLLDFITKLEPVGYGNYSPIFLSKDVEVVETKTVGSENKHIKMKLKQDSKIIDAIWFNAKSDYISSKPIKANIAFTVEENVWNNKTSIQLKIRDIRNDKDIKII
ncbi:MAG: single-stranded-DNA-specific exonuclease RecJ [bacterium]|nr:MAG: single-stranded-DNA-specific exonuclease RecJ [bacterium]